MASEVHCRQYDKALYQIKFLHMFLEVQKYRLQLNAYKRSALLG